MRKLIVGGGRHGSFPKLKVSDISININAAALPHIVGDIFHHPFKPQSFDHILFERFPWHWLLERRPSGITISASLLKPGGILVILTGLVPLGNIIPDLERNDFEVDSVHVQRHKDQAMLVWCHGEWMDPGGVYIRAFRKGHSHNGRQLRK